jgi:hypothetical protein
MELESIELVDLDAAGLELMQLFDDMHDVSVLDRSLARTIILRCLRRYDELIITDLYGLGIASSCVCTAGEACVLYVRYFNKEASSLLSELVIDNMYIRDDTLYIESNLRQIMIKLGNVYIDMTYFANVLILLCTHFKFPYDALKILLRSDLA